MPHFCGVAVSMKEKISSEVFLVDDDESLSFQLGVSLQYYQRFASYSKTNQQEIVFRVTYPLLQGNLPLTSKGL